MYPPVKEVLWARWGMQRKQGDRKLKNASTRAEMMLLFSIIVIIVGQ
jgi:hypothetical protein